MSMGGRQAEFLSAEDPEAVYLEHLQQIVDSFDGHAAPGDDSAFRPLMLGYVGANNVGADLRVAEMLRQYATIYTDFQPTVMTIGGNADADLFSNYRLQLMDRYFPDYLEQEAGAHNAIVSCEGSMFTSTFSDVLSSIFASGLGLAARRGMPAIGFVS